MPKVQSSQATPNPNALKFVLDTSFDESFQVNGPEDAEGNPLAEKLIEIDDVDSVFGTSNFITVNKKPGASWADLRNLVTDVIEAED